MKYLSPGKLMSGLMRRFDPRFERAMAALRIDVELKVERVRTGTGQPDDFACEFDRIFPPLTRARAQTGTHEPDFAVFEFFQPDAGIIVDVGANLGTSVNSIRASGCRCPVVSFEALPIFAAALEQIRSMYQEPYAYVMCGVGSSSGSFELLTPLLDGVANTPLTSSRPESFSAWTVGKIMSYARRRQRVSSPNTFRFLKTQAAVERLDTLLARKDLGIGNAPVAAVKIDVEGAEADVLMGADGTLRAHRPLLLIEGGNRPPAVGELLDRLGYVVAEREGKSLSLSSGYSKAINGFFVHPARFDDYRRAGILN